MRPFKDKLPEAFDSPTALPKDAKQAFEWQNANRSWWETHPMRYDWKQEIYHKEFTAEYYKEIDNRFFSEVEKFMPWEKIPFDSLINFDSLKDMDVLEIGVGSGSCASLFAQYARSFKGIDITEYAIKSTSGRIQSLRLKAEIIRMDAEYIQFSENAFDFIWSWGVIHHSSNTRKVLQEMHKVLKPGGKAITMVYHRNFWNYYIMGGLLRGALWDKLFKRKSLHNIVQQWMDGAIARIYSIPEWENLASEFFYVEKTLIFGNKSGIIPLPSGKIKQFVSLLIPNSLSRFLTNRCRMGSFLVTVLKKR